MIKYLLSLAETMLLVIGAVFLIRRQNQNAEQKESRNPVRFHFTFGRNKFARREGHLYTPKRKINRHGSLSIRCLLFRRKTPRFTYPGGGASLYVISPYFALKLSTSNRKVRLS